MIYGCIFKYFYRSNFPLKEFIMNPKLSKEYDNNEVLNKMNGKQCIS